MHVPSPSAEKDRARTAARRRASWRQLTDTMRDAHGLVAEVASSVTGRVDRAVRIARDGLDRVTRVDYGNDEVETFAYDKWGRLSAHARADYGGGRSEDFAWDGLALVRRGGEQFVNEPHPGNAPKKLCFEGKPRAERSARRARKGPRGTPVLSSEGVAYLNDLLGTTVGVRDGPRGRRRHTPAALTAFGEPLPGAAGGAAAVPSPFFTGKPDVPGLGCVFLFRSYRPGLAKWQTAAPLGYPDGWNQLAYGVNSPTMGYDVLGASWGNVDFVAYYFLRDPSRPNYTIVYPKFATADFRFNDSALHLHLKPPPFPCPRRYT